MLAVTYKKQKEEKNHGLNANILSADITVLEYCNNCFFSVLFFSISIIASGDFQISLIFQSNPNSMVWREKKPIEKKPLEAFTHELAKRGY